ncbi:MAG: ornithine cyclodeaminase family protein [Halobacteriota archaeon]|nr:ornithine cyclodeaminase family protein [Halobacteriota archaeon]
MGTLILSTDDVKSCADIKAVLEAVEGAFIEYGEGRAIMPPKEYIDLPKGDFRAMPSFIDGAVGLKWVCVYPDNPKKESLPTVMGVVILCDPDTGYPISVMDGTLVTQLRTGASAGVASKYLARGDSESVGLVGCGAQARTQLKAILANFDIDIIKIYDISRDVVAGFKEYFSDENLNILECTIEEVVGCDIISTVTPVREPLVKREWVRSGTHINAIGADAPGKQELDSKIIIDAKVVVDDIRQASHGGEINVPIAENIFKSEDIYATLGEIVSGRKNGRESDEITVFDSTGLAIQDMATAKVIYQVAKDKGLGILVDFVGMD